MNCCLFMINEINYLINLVYIIIRVEFLVEINNSLVIMWSILLGYNIVI